MEARVKLKVRATQELNGKMSSEQRSSAFPGVIFPLRLNILGRSQRAVNVLSVCKMVLPSGTALIQIL